MADGNVLDQQIVSGGAITLSNYYSKVHIGIPIESDFETLNIEIGLPTIQGNVVKIGNVTFRFVNSLGGWIGPDEDNLYEAMTSEYMGSDLFNGDIRFPLGAGYEDGGRIFYRQSDPLPVTITAVIPETTLGG